MRSRLVPVLLLACWPFAVAACAVSDDAEVRAAGSTTSTEAQGTTTTEASTEGSTTTTPSTEAVRVGDVVDAFEDAGYQVDLVEVDAPSAEPDAAVEHQLLEVDGGSLGAPTDIEIWTFADAAAAEGGADDVRDEAGGDVGGAFVVQNGSVIGLLGCTCEDDSTLADVFVGLDLGSGGRPPVPTTSTTDPRVIPGGDPDDAGDERLAAVLDELADAGATVLGTDEVDEDLGAEVAAAVEVEVDGEIEVVEIHVFDDADRADDAADALEESVDERCGGVCEEVVPVAVVVGEVVFVADEGAAVLDVVEDVELP